MNDKHLKEYIVGRARGCNILLPDADATRTVSGRHLRIMETGAPGIFEVEDLHSCNGTYLERGGEWEEVGKARCHVDDKLRLGLFETTLRQLLPPGHSRRDKHGNIVKTGHLS